MPSHHKSAIPATPLLLIIGILLIASNLRAAVTGVAPLLDTMLRLVRLLDTPRDIGMLAPLALRDSASASTAGNTAAVGWPVIQQAATLREQPAPHPGGTQAAPRQGRPCAPGARQPVPGPKVSGHWTDSVSFSKTAA